MLIFRLFCLLAFSFGMSHINYAMATPPPPQKKQIDLKQVEKNINTRKAEKKALELQKKNIERELRDAKSELVEIGRSVQKHEQTLKNLEDQVLSLENEQKNIEHKLQDDRRSIAKLLMALQRLERTPPEAMILNPKSPYRAAQGGLLMENIVSAIQERSLDLKQNLERIAHIEKDLVSQRKKATQESSALKKDYDHLRTLTKTRERLYEKTREDLKAEEQSILAMSLQAKDLKDLLVQIDKREAQKKALQEKQRKSQNINTRSAGLSHAPKKQKKKMPIQDLKKGVQLPIKGVLRVAYNQLDDFGAPSQGIEIEARGGALIVAPMSGTIRFSGPFKNYGQIVIIEHSSGYHSLIAGLESIQTDVGRDVQVGEPIGTLHYASTNEEPVLYYELRKDGKAVNPSVKLGQLG